MCCTQGCQILVSSEASDETAFPRALWRVGMVAELGRVDGWEALGKAVLAETEPRSVAEPNVLSPSRQIRHQPSGKRKNFARIPIKDRAEGEA